MKNILFIGVIGFILAGCVQPKIIESFNGENYYHTTLPELNLMGSYFVDKVSCAEEECGKALFFPGEMWYRPSVYIIDFDKKEWNYYSIRDVFSKDRRLFMQLGGSDKYDLYKHTSAENKYNFKNVDNKNYTKNIYYFVRSIHKRKLFDNYSTMEFYTKFFKTNKYINGYKFDKDGLRKKGYKHNPTLSLLSSKSQNKQENYIAEFINRYNLNTIAQEFSAKQWFSKDKKSQQGITGKGSISFNGSNKYSISITGTFNNGKLISQGKIFIRKWFSDGRIHLFTPSSTKEQVISSTTNIRGTILTMYKSLDIDISNYISRENTKHSQTYSSSGSKIFSCTYSCLSDVGLLYETYRNVGSMKISSNSYSSAKDKANNIAEERCKTTLDKHGYKMRGGSVDCDFGR